MQTVRMSTASGNDHNSDNIRIALDEILKMLGEYARLAAWRQLEVEFHISLGSTKTLTKAEVEYALQQLFGKGAELLVKSFENELAKLKNGS